MAAPTIVLSWYQILPALEAWKAGKHRVTISPDLNRTQVAAILDIRGVVFPDGEQLSWSDAARIAESRTHCFTLQAGEISAIQTFSQATHWVRSLMPSELAPTMLVSGTPMHRIVGIDPYHDTLRKVKTIAPIHGIVLDTATGLGYTAIEASRTADRVISVELDPASLEIARYNPWSEALFDNPKIELIAGDISEVIGQFEDRIFSRIIHDPPTFSLAGDLYSAAFYRQMHRVLRPQGRVFHYIGDLSSKTGQGVARGIMRRLQDAGFARIQRRPEAFGIVAYAQ